MERDLRDRGWISFTFDDIASSLKRGPFGSSLKKSFFVPTGYKVYEQQNAINDDHTLGTYYIDEEKYEELKSFTVGPGDYILSCSGTIGKLSRLPKEAPIGVINQALLKITLNENLIHHKYFVYLFRSQLFLNRILKDARGSGMKNLAGIAELKAMPVNLPPKAEQNKIVEKIDEYLSELDNGIANLKLAQEQLKVYRQAVLKKAFEGKLTKKWREQQMDLPDAGDLLEQIRKEKEKAAKNSGKKMNKINPFTEAELAKFPRLPEGWGWERLEGIGYWTGGGTPSKKNQSYWINGDVLWVSPKDMKTTLIVDTRDKITKDSIENSSAKWIAKDSILFVVRSGIIRRILPIALAGKNLTTNQDLQSLTLFWGDKDYVFWYCQANEQIIRDKCAKDGTTVDNIEVPRLKSYPISICSLAEQQAIVQEIETRLSVCDKIEQDIETNLEKAEALRQSILKKAFEGKLLNEKELAEVRRAEDWEPAGVLLERVKAEKTASGKKGRS